MLIKLVFLAALFVSSIMAALSDEEMTDTLIAEMEKDLVQTFKKFKEEQDEYELNHALANVAQVQEHIPKVATCLRTVDPFPSEMSNVGRFVHFTVGLISYDTRDDSESFANVIASFKPSDGKPLASIRYRILWRRDAKNVLESVMKQSPELITDDLPRWLADHSFDQNSDGYTLYEVARKQSFQYLTSFATEDILNDSLSIVKTNEHFMVDSLVCCCNSQNSFPQGLYNKLSALLDLLKIRKAFIKVELELLLPQVLAKLVLDHVQVE